MNRKEKISYLTELASRCDRLGLHCLASKVDKVLEAEVGGIEAIISIYKDLHKVASSEKNLTRKLEAALRRDNRPDVPSCPFGLPIPRACKYAGDIVLEMSWRPVEGKHNRRVYNKQRKHCQCPYALQILDSTDAVHCTFATINAKIPHWKQYNTSPFYPKLWQGFNIPDITLDRNYYTYNDFNYFSYY